MFIDSDDYIEKDSIRLLIEAMAENNSDIVQMGHNRVCGFIKKSYFSHRQPRVTNITQPTLFEKYYISFFGVNLLEVSMCGKLYRIETLRSANLSPSGFKMGEDLIFNLKLFPFIHTYTLIDYKGYNYRVGGLTSRYNPTLWSDLKKQYLIKHREATIHNYSQAYRPLAIELKNIFRSEISQRIFYLNESKDDLIRWIKKEISDDVYWSDLKKYRTTDEDLITQHIIHGNANGILDEVRVHMNHNRKKQLVKRFLMKLMK